MQTTEFTIRVAEPPGVGSIATGLNGLGQLGETIFQVGRDYREKKAVNPILRGQGALDATVSNVSPVLGCYLMACSTRSNVLHVLFDQMGQRGWMTEVERLNKEVGPVVDSARRIIGSSRFVIPGMPLNPTKEQPGTKEQKKAFAANRKYARAGRFHRFFLSQPPKAGLTGRGSA